MNVKSIIASVTSDEFAEELLGDSRIQDARDDIESVILDSKLEELKEAGVDECTVCGEEVAIAGAETWDDIHATLEQHAHARADHVHIPDKGWILEPDNGARE